MVERLEGTGRSSVYQLHWYTGALLLLLAFSPWVSLTFVYIYYQSPYFSTTCFPLLCTCQIRSIYRTIELSQGYVGPLATNEATFYGLDTLPLFIAVVIYLPFWPGRFIDEERLRLLLAEQKAVAAAEKNAAGTGAPQGDLGSDRDRASADVEKGSEREEITSRRS